VGAGSLGSALIGHEEFAEYGLEISAVFDSNPDRIDSIIHGHKVTDVRRMSEVLRDDPPELGIICVPSNCAQMVTDELISCGVKAFWNFANVCLRVPQDVIVQREVIAGGFAMLSVKMAKRNLKQGEFLDD
jgi:redox-sensing transcriptional repressor